MTHEKQNILMDSNNISDNKGKAVGAQPKKRRKSKEERLQAALARQQALQTKINGLKSELDENKKKNRNRGLMLVGIVVEQCFKKGALTEKNVAWWLDKVRLLPEKDREAYKAFLQSLPCTEQI